MKPKTRSLYGFSPKLAPFAGKTVAEQVSLFRSWGNTVVFGGYQDPAVVDAFHEAGMPVYAEFGCFVGQDWWTRVPASRPVTDDGRPLETDDWYHGLNPITPQVRQERLEALEKLVTEHDIDGVWLDFIRWPCHWEFPEPHLPRTSFDTDTLSLFGRDTGIDLGATTDAVTAARTLLGRYEEEWTRWRCEQITSWVAEAKALLKRTRPHALLGLFSVPWRLADYGGGILKVIGQDYHALGKHVDIFSPMVYHVMCGRTPEWIAEVTEEVHALSGKPVWPIIQSVDRPNEPLSAEAYGQALDGALGSPAAEGVLVFTLEGALDAANLEVTKQKFGS